MSDTSPFLVLVRHGKAESGAEGSDHDRPLTARGRSEAAATGRRVAALLAGRQVDLAWVSSATRAHQTWARIAVALPAPGQLVVERDLYQASGRDVLGRVESAMTADTAMTADADTDADRKARVMVVVGHNPTMEQVVRALVGELHAMRPGTAAVIELDADVTAPLRGRLVELVSPRG